LRRVRVTIVAVEKQSVALVILRVTSVGCLLSFVAALAIFFYIISLTVRFSGENVI